MKKILSIAFLFLSFAAFAQYPAGIQTLGNDSNLVKAKGGFTASMLQIPSFADTTAANASPYVKYYLGSVIRVNDKILLRHNGGWYEQGSSAGWGLTGTAGTNPGVNYIGTSDNQNVYFRRNAVSAGMIDGTAGNTSFGAGTPTYLGAFSVTAFGVSALASNIGTGNTGIGRDALVSNSTGISNTAVGHNALFANGTSSYNTAVGKNAINLGVGEKNTAVGESSFYSANTGSENSVLGQRALYYTTTASRNIAIGVDAGTYYYPSNNNVAGDGNIYIGNITQALGTGQTNQIVFGDTAIGHGSNTATWGNRAITAHYFSGNIYANGVLLGAGGAAWGGITGTLSSQTDLQTALNLKANLVSPAFTSIPTAPTAAPGTNTTQIATTAFTQAAISALPKDTLFITAASQPTMEVITGSGKDSLGFKTQTANKVLRSGDAGGIPAMSALTTADMPATVALTANVSRRVVSSNVQLSNTGSTTENTILTTSIPANSIGVNGSFHITWLQSTNANNANLKDLRIYFNGVLVSTQGANGLVSISGYSIIRNRNSMSAQVSGTTNSTNNTFGSGTSGSPTTFTFNTAATITVTVTSQLANSADTQYLQGFEIIAYP